MSQPNLSQVPLLGALCVAAGLVSQEDLDFCLALQAQTSDGTPIGQILVLHNYLTERDLARMVAQQQNFRRMFCVTLDQSLIQGGRTSAPAAPISAPAVQSALPELGAFAATELDSNPVFSANR
jgi:hypothetical protein